MKKTTINFPDEAYEKLLELKNKRILRTVVDTLVYCILEMHEKEFNNYKEVLKNRVARPVLSIEDKAMNEERKRKEKQDARMKVMIQTARGICSRLEGNEINNENGTFGCEYQMFEKVGRRVLRGKRIVPYDLLTDEHAVLQYKGGTKEEIDLLVKGENK